MTNFNDFDVQQQDFSALKNFWHVISGLYIWEYFTTLNFELDFIRGRRSYRWTIWVYSFARMAILVATILSLVDLNVKTPINCQVVITLQATFGYLGLAAASLMVILRIIAIWDGNKFVVMVAIILWVASVSVIIEGVAKLRAAWVPLLQTCVVLNSQEMKPIIITLVDDVILLVTVLIGLLYLRTGGSYSFGLGRLLWKQGVIWLLIATTAGIPPMVFIILNLNVPFNLMFQLPSTTITIIAATRMYRSLADYVFGTTDVAFDSLSKGGNKVSKIKWNTSAPDSLSRFEVAVDTACEQYPTSETTLSVSTQRNDKPHELSVDGDQEAQ